MLVCVRFFSSTSLMLGYALGSDHPRNPLPTLHWRGVQWGGHYLTLQVCPSRLYGQTFTSVSTWAAEMSLNCLFLGQPIFNLLPLPNEETIRLRCFNFWKQMEESIAKTIRLVLELTIVPPGPAPLLPSFCWPSSYPLAGLALKYELQWSDKTEL